MSAAPILDDAEVDRRLRFATEIATVAGGKLLELRRTNRWTDETVLGDVADHLADGFLQGALRGRHPDDAVLSEETKDSPERLTARCVWIVDPLDGTHEYRCGRHDWAVHVGLVVDGAPVLGVVVLPAIDRVLVGTCPPVRPIVAVRSGAPALQEHGPTVLPGIGDRLAGDANTTRPLRFAVSRSHAAGWIDAFARELAGDQGSELVPTGSVGFKVGLLLLGGADVYVHDRGLKEWDTLAPEAVARAAGWSVCRLDGTAHRYNRPDPRNDELVVCRPTLLPRVLQALAHHAPRLRSS